MYAIVKRYPEPKAEIATLEIPKAGESQVLVKVKATSICGTDIHIWDWNQWAQNRVKKLPIIFGHEVAGEVVQVGQNVTDLREGDMISAETHIADGTCYQCRTDQMHICQNLRILGVDTDGVFAEYFSLPEENAWKNDPRLEPVIASVQEPLGNAVQAVLPKDHIADIAEKNVAVMGCGPIGLMSIAVLKELGAAKILATAGGSNKVRMELAKEMGADVVLNAKDDDKSIVKTMRDATDGNGVDVVLEMSGASAAIKQALEVLTPGGRISLLGIFERPVELDLNDALIFKGATVFGITGRRMFQTWYQVKDLLANSRFREKISRIITHRLPMRDIAKGVDLIKSKQTGKVSLEPKW